jgi:hypothetical protein
MFKNTTFATSQRPSSSTSSSADLSEKSIIESNNSQVFEYASEEGFEPFTHISKTASIVSSVSEVDDTYTIRFNKQKGEASPYEKRFDPNYLIVDGEFNTFRSGVKKTFSAHEEVNQLKAIRQKVEIWKRLKGVDENKQSQQDLKYSGESKVNVEETAERVKRELGLENIDPEIIEAHVKGVPLMIKALDFGCGDGRSLGLWKEMAKDLQDSGIVLRVVAYDVVRSALDSFESRLICPIFPEKYSSAWKESCGEDVYKEKLPKDRYGLHEDDYEKLKHHYGALEYKEVLSRNNLSDIESKLRQHYGDSEYERRANLSGISEDDRQKLEHFYGESIYQNKRQNQDFPQESDREILKNFYGEEEYDRRLQPNVYITDSDRQKLQNFYGEEVCKKREEQYVFLESQLGEGKYNEDTYKEIKGTYDRIYEQEDRINLKNIYEQEDCENLTKSYGSEAFLQNSHEQDIKNIKAIYEEEDVQNLERIYGEEVLERKKKERKFPSSADLIIIKKAYGEEIYAQELEKENFPTPAHYDRLKKVFGDREINEFISHNAKFTKMDSASLLEVYGEEFQNKDGAKSLGVYKCDNLEIDLLHGDVNKVDPHKFRDVIGPVDMSLILYGSTSHIVPKEIRDEFLKSIIAITKDCMVATLPGQQGRSEELKKAELSRESGDDLLAPGEIRYIPAESRDKKEIVYATYKEEYLHEILSGIYGELSLEKSKKDNLDVSDRNHGFRSRLNSEVTPLLAKSERMSQLQENKYSVKVATKYNPADISSSTGVYLADKLLTPVTNAVLKLPSVIKDKLPSCVTEVRYYSVLADGARKGHSL